MYRTIEQPGKNEIKDLQKKLDDAVVEAYGFDSKKDLLSQLLELNIQVQSAEAANEEVTAPGLPDYIKNKKDFISKDCVKFDWED